MKFLSSVAAMTFVSLFIGFSSAQAGCLDTSEIITDTSARATSGCTQIEIFEYRDENGNGTGEYNGGYSFDTEITETRFQQVTNTCTSQVVSSKTYKKKTKDTRTFLVMGWMGRGDYGDVAYGLDAERGYCEQALKAMKSK